VIDERAAFRPHRSYRRPASLARAGWWTSLALTPVVQAAAVLTRGTFARFLTRGAGALVPGGGARFGHDLYLGVRLVPITVNGPSLTRQTLVLWISACAGGLFVLIRRRRLPAPLRFIGVANLGLVGATACYLLFMGRLGYDPAAFSALYVRTSLTIWLIVPVFMGMVALTLPFTVLERIGLVLFCLAYEGAFATVRYAVFVWVLGEVGSVVMPSMYLFFGPLLDFVTFTGIYAVLLARLARRMALTEGAWRWL
jgi:hypothetical protein